MFFLLQNEGNKQKINLCDEQIDGKVQQTNIVNDVEERRVTGITGLWWLERIIDIDINIGLN